MRHRKSTNKLGRTKSHRRATLRNLASAIVEHQQIKTTLVKAKAARSAIDKLITIGKKDTVAARRQAFKLLQNHALVKKLFEEIAPTFADRSGGYSRVIKLGRRRGDGAELAILQLVGFEPVIVEEKKASKKKKETPAKKETAKKETTETKAAPVEEEKKEKPVKKETKKKAASTKDKTTEKTAKSEKAASKTKEKTADKKETKAEDETKAEEKQESKKSEQPEEDKNQSDTEKTE